MVRAIVNAEHRLAARRVEALVMAGRVLALWGDSALARAGGRLARWLVEEACPRAAAGRVDGLFADGAPFGAAVQGDMVCAFILAGRLGWRGPWAACVGQTLDVLLAQGARDGAVLRALAMAGRALGRADWGAVAPRDVYPPDHPMAERVLNARDAAEALAGVEAFDLAAMGGADLWPVAQVACALLRPEDRLWLYP